MCTYNADFFIYAKENINVSHQIQLKGAEIMREGKEGRGGGKGGGLK